MAKTTSAAELLDAMRSSVEAAAMFEALAEQAAAVAGRQWWTEGAGREGVLERSFARDARRLAKQADALRAKYHTRSVEAAEALAEAVSKIGRKTA